jgi:mannose/cellobiose epimerase-like protein (N-acyl-D-glucosamine 2-epimerase family)
MDDISKRVAETVARWPQGGYAPGGYMCKCSTCGKTHQAEKRAWQCADCVIQRLAAELAEARVAALEEAAREADDHNAKGDMGNPGHWIRAMKEQQE